MGQAQVEVAKLKAQAKKIKADGALEMRRKREESDLNYTRRLNSIKGNHEDRLAKIESEKFKRMIDAIGPDTLKSIAQAGPELQAKLLGGLGIKSTVIVDGNNPLNLFGTANGMLQA